MTHRLIRSIQWLLLAAFVLYLGDWLAVEARIPSNTAFGSIKVKQFLGTPLKGQKEEYDYMGEDYTTCSRSLFPQFHYKPCWWVKRHPVEWE